MSELKDEWQVEWALGVESFPTETEAKARAYKLAQAAMDSNVYHYRVSEYRRLDSTYRPQAREY
jgi:hypothetical protein